VAKLENIEITHISLVKSGANKKSIIFKSSDKETSYDKFIGIVKKDDEQGIVYGIVYSPDEEDTQGDSATADEIRKASYLFMKSRNTLNVDTNHDFKLVDAFVAESWIVKSNDAIFPEEKEGAWAVAIQLESDELKEQVKKGDINGLSMAGEAIKKENEDPWDAFFLALKGVMRGVYFSMSGSVDNPNILKSQEFEQSIKETLLGILPVAKNNGVIEKKNLADVNNKIKKLEEKTKEQEALIKTLQTDVKKSKQTPHIEDEKEKNKREGIL
jgi:hypothetical protein